MTERETQLTCVRFQALKPPVSKWLKETKIEIKFQVNCKYWLVGLICKSDITDTLILNSRKNVNKNLIVSCFLFA